MFVLALSYCTNI